MADQNEELRSLALTPTWSVATVMTIFVVVSLIVERSIHRLSFWLKTTHRNPLFQALEKMKEELMLLGFISLLLSASSRIISNICIDSKFYAGRFTPCTRDEVEDTKNVEAGEAHDHRHLMGSIANHSIRRVLNNLDHNTCKQGYEPFVSYEGLEQLHRFIFVMAITHVLYSCLTMLLAIVKIHSWRKWEDEAHTDRFDCLTEVSRALTMRRQSTFVKSHASNIWSRNRFLVWLICFLRQFGTSVARGDYLTLRSGFITNHHLRRNYDFHNYMIQCMEDEFKTIVGVSAPLWGFVIAFMLFNINGSNLYFWIAAIPIALVLMVGAKLQHIIATLALENAIQECSLKPRDELFWFKRPELLLSLIHFVLFQNAFELASFFWFWWQFGYNSCYLLNHWLVYARLFFGFAGQFLCSYSTLPLYALVTQMGSNYKAALIPRRIRESLHTWKNDVKRNRHHKGHRHSVDGSTTIHTETSTICSIEEDEQLLEDPSCYHTIEIELQPTSSVDGTVHTDDRESINRSSSARLLPAPVPSSPLLSESQHEQFLRTMSLPVWRK